MKKPVVTNVMRLLRQAGIACEPMYYDLAAEPFSSEAVCRALGIDPATSFKTLCAQGARRGVAVFVVRTGCELDLKKAARALDDKSVSLCHVRDLPAIAGYERGAVSPVGMKKRYPTFIDCSAEQLPEMKISGGQKGVSVRVDPRALASYLGAVFADLIQE